MSLLTKISCLEKKADLIDRLVNNAGVWTTKPEAGPEDGPEKFGNSMFEQSIDLWQQGTLFQDPPCVKDLQILTLLPKPSSSMLPLSTL